MFIVKATPLFSPDGVEGGTEEVTTAVQPPQEEVKVETASQPDEKDVKKDEPKGNTDDGIDLEGFETLEDGRVKFQWGNSTYFSEAGLRGNAAVQDAYKKARVAEEEKDKAFRELKARVAITPKPKVQTDESTKRYSLEQWSESVFKQHKLSPDMAYWDNARWKQLAREVGDDGDRKYEPFEITELKGLVEKAWGESVKRHDLQEQLIHNERVIDEATENIQDLLVSIKVDPDKYADAYANILGLLETEKNKFFDSSGKIIPGRIEKEMSKAIYIDLTPKQESELRKKILTEQEEAVKARAKVHPIGSATKELKPETKQPKSLGDARQSALKALKAGRL